MGHKTPEPPDVPDCAGHICGWYWELAGQRRSGMAGVEPIGWQDIEAWRSLKRLEVQPEVVDILLAMDSAYREEANEISRAKRNAAKDGGGGGKMSM